MTLNKDKLIDIYYNMLRIRRFEETVKKKHGKQIIGPAHLYIGEEAVATGVCSNLLREDLVTSTHRGHGHTLAKGANLRKAFAELYGKETGYCKGRGGSMHLAAFDVGMLGANGVVGGGFNIATGAALTQQILNKKNVVVCFFGDGASNRGTFHEAVNLAALWNLPVIYVCENNGWASTTNSLDSTAVVNIADRARGYGIKGITVDGNDVFAVYNAAQKLIKAARNGDGPAILEAKTYRIEGHFLGDPQKYRTASEVEEWKLNNDPIERFLKAIRATGEVSEPEIENVKRRIEDELEDAVQFAERSIVPTPEDALEDVYAKEAAR
ncbi:acetoin dehydrogenase E1 component alpha-subunit [Liquorilactobacillus sucicola DSM 21376 = JCM 15457]|uniref:TPP-dependent acetoin dehydrogenase complex, E1 component subunit alpha n=1 Tax=Liquorilactobacillus sucicola DSM 21376 = JCM 15457 TaxID=1423806 RepID=A0A023CXC0_9LACO|nr:thiamine pyrophosphate-dependent dehydrogenase E1 component subunit alpha [Liquorilactobacillus sucicola]KRN07049.1 TPP-dependent acetoin dehydrogenase complex, E1 component subunit alpha [Liquorilactobacillus sucicola DSM 21376 = JCM 15457]GAJ26543.1 acetoin dehydrogenase E1 component alpha-subunit [Liquorilactobacillus sucicola DSM 21376 = JCM 15457]